MYGVDLTAIDVARQVISAYLSRQHLEHIEGGCPMIALSSDVARSDSTVKRAFETVFESMASLFEESLRREKRPDR